MILARASDVGHLQQSVLVARSHAEGSKTCVLTDLHEHVEEEARMVVTAARPTGKDIVHKDERAAEHSAMLEYLCENASWCILPHRSSHCLVHKCQCPLNPGWATTERLKGCNPRRLMEMFSGSAGVREVPEGAWWTLPELGPQLLEDSEGVKPLVVNIASLICVDHTPLGKQAGAAGDSQEEHNTWVATADVNAKRGHVDLYFTECSHRYKVQKEQQKLQSTHKVISVKTSPLEQSFPIRRSRCLGAGINLQSLIWCGPATEDEIQREFNSLYHRELQLTGGIYFTDGDDSEEVYENHASYAPAGKTFPRHLHGRGLFESNIQHRVLTPSNLIIKGECDDHFRVSNIPAPHFAHLDQRPSHGSTPGNVLPSFDTHPKIYSWERDRLATPDELYDAMGADLRPGTFAGSREVSSLACALPMLSRKNKFSWAPLKFG